jgi:ABC-type proline/glycine betaine transport system substrate-binding protein
MSRTTLLLCTLLFLGVSAHAADDSKPAEAPPIKPGWTLLPDEAGEAKIEQAVIEDEHTRIEQLRVRGQTQKVKVHKKNSIAPDYEIVMGDAGHDWTYEAGSTRFSIGQRVWRLFDF